MVGMILALAVGIALGVIATILITCARSAGNLRVDNSDPADLPLFCLEKLKISPYKVAKRKYITFKVHVENFISQD